MFWYEDYFLFSLGKSPSRKKLTKYKNDAVFMNTFMHLMNIAISEYSSRLEFKNETINGRLIIQALIVYASCVFFRKDGDSGLLSLAGVPSGKGWNIYGDPLSAWIFSRNGLMNEEIDLYIPGSDIAPELDKSFSSADFPLRNKGFMLFDNKNRYPLIKQIVYYSEAISDTLRTIDVARKWYKMPSIPVCEQSLVDSVNSTLNAISDNDEIIPVSSGMQTVDKFTLAPVGDVTKNISSATALIDWYTERFKSVLGIENNTNINKKGENLNSEEINIDVGLAETLDTSKWDYIKEQCENLNSYFGEPVVTVKEVPEPQPEEGEINNGTADTGGVD